MIVGIVFISGSGVMDGKAKSDGRAGVRWDPGPTALAPFSLCSDAL